MSFWASILVTVCAVVGGETVCSVETCSPHTITLYNRIEMPLVGMGLAGMRGDLTKQSVWMHVEHGFRFFDGAQAKEWYDDVSAGDALQSLIQDGQVQRNDVFLSSKVHPGFLSEVPAAVQEMLQSWHTDVMDLVLLHYPACFSGIRDCQNKPTGDWREAWRALEALVDAGTIRAIGVSNFDLAQLEALWSMARIQPHVVQMWIDPFHQARAEVAFCKAHGAAVFSYSSLGTQWESIVGRNVVWENAVLASIAKKHVSSIPAIVLSYFIQQQIGVVPRSTSLHHVADNAKLLTQVVPLDKHDIASIDDLDGFYDN
ncbi:hypothetical protein AeMF1_005523 [Aphanomyces euteiches]|nr:hypothetical protein AeMF1_005523 [Aphanomyces euteiches]KAH9187314.1 hypothetical protein AeNC1_010712 [Aphanomyces euteiches]